MKFRFYEDKIFKSRTKDVRIFTEKTLKKQKQSKRVNKEHKKLNILAIKIFYLLFFLKNAYNQHTVVHLVVLQQYEAEVELGEG